MGKRSKEWVKKRVDEILEADWRQQMKIKQSIYKNEQRNRKTSK